MEMLAIRESGQKEGWCALTGLASFSVDSKSLKKVLEEKISCYDCSTKAYHLPGNTECKYKNTRNSLKS